MDSSAFRFAVTEKGEIEREVNIEISRSAYDQRFSSALNRAASSARVKGFRPGRVPRAIVAKMYGTDIHQDVMGDLVGEALTEVVKKHELHVVGHPKVHYEDVKENEDFRVRAGLSVVPKPNIKNYKKVEFEVETQEVTDADVEHELQHLRERYASFEPLEKKETEKGDYVEIDFDATVDGQAFKGSKREAAVIEIGAGKLPDALEAGLLGMKIEEQKKISVTFPEDLRDSALSGKTADYNVKLNKILKRVLPEVNDEFAKLTGAGETVEALKAEMKKLISEQVEKQNLGEREKKLFETLLEANSFQVPPALVHSEIRQILFEMGVLDPRNRKSFDMDMSGFMEALGPQAEFRAKKQVALQQIITQESFEVSEDDINKWFETAAKEQNQTREALEKAYDYPRSKANLKQSLAFQLMAEKLLADAKVKENIVARKHECS